MIYIWGTTTFRMDDVMPTPMYQKIADELIDRIEKGDLCPGDKLPTETELGGSYSVSRITVTHAIRILQNRGLVYRVKGSGTFVSKRSTSGLAFGNRTANGMSFISVIFPQGEQNGAHDILIGIESECAKGDFYVTIHTSKNKPVLEQSPSQHGHLQRAHHPRFPRRIHRPPHRFLPRAVRRLRQREAHA
jgi:DNA-binding transcriptional regulator YhcF (GntR family)